MLNDAAADWYDEDFIDYCRWHSRTDRALFHRDHVKRMAKLAGDEVLAARAGTFPEWVAVHEEAMMPLVEKARAKLASAGA
jgi:hypothetical protein